jgi:hypothetical protein
MLETLATGIGLIVTLGGLIAGWYKSRQLALRREEVHKWADEAITALDSLFLLTALRPGTIDEASGKARLEQVIFDTSILTERGRLFFRNVVTDSYGAEKEPAYRGYRPVILDHLVTAHKIACEWGSSDLESRLRMRLVAEACLKKFVSLAQKEVGRSRAASADTARGGSGSGLRSLMARVDGTRLAGLRERACRGAPPPPLSADPAGASRA